MKLINYANNKKYKSNEANKWAKDMLKGLKHDLKCYEKQYNMDIRSCEMEQLGDYLEGKFNTRFIKWFIENYNLDSSGRLLYRFVYKNDNSFLPKQKERI